MIRTLLYLLPALLLHTEPGGDLVLDDDDWGLPPDASVDGADGSEGSQEAVDSDRATDPRVFETLDPSADRDLFWADHGAERRGFGIPDLLTETDVQVPSPGEPDYHADVGKAVREKSANVQRALRAADASLAEHILDLSLNAEELTGGAYERTVLEIAAYARLADERAASAGPPFDEAGFHAGRYQALDSKFVGGRLIEEVVDVNGVRRVVVHSLDESRELMRQSREAEAERRGMGGREVSADLRDLLSEFDKSITKDFALQYLDLDPEERHVVQRRLSAEQRTALRLVAERLDEESR